MCGLNRGQGQGIGQQPSLRRYLSGTGAKQGFIVGTSSQPSDCCCGNAAVVQSHLSSAPCPALLLRSVKVLVTAELAIHNSIYKITPKSGTEIAGLKNDQGKFPSCMSQAHPAHSRGHLGIQSLRCCPNCGLLVAHRRYQNCTSLRLIDRRHQNFGHLTAHHPRCVSCNAPVSALPELPGTTCSSDCAKFS